LPGSLFKNYFKKNFPKVCLTVNARLTRSIRAGTFIAELNFWKVAWFASQKLFQKNFPKVCLTVNKLFSLIFIL